MRLGISAISGAIKGQAKKAKQPAPNIVSRSQTYEGKVSKKRKRTDVSTDGILPASNMFNSTLTQQD